ncbi:MAG: VPLPA-CTERM sorting domain-containing protein [Xanthobacteraceae bacterium]
MADAKVYVRCLALSLVSFATAKASPIIVTYTGTITNGVDNTGVFGPANTSLTGDKISVAFTFDVAQGVLSNGATFSQLVGGGNATVTINNISVNILTLPAIPGATTTLLLNQDNGFGNRFTHEIVNTLFFDNSTFVSERADVSVSDPHGIIPVSILQPYTLIVDPGQGNGQFTYDNHQPFQPPPGVPFDHSDDANGSFTVETLTVAEATPLPAAMPMLASGLGLMGFAGWRRKRIKSRR